MQDSQCKKCDHAIQADLTCDQDCPAGQLYAGRRCVYACLADEIDGQCTTTCNGQSVLYTDNCVQECRSGAMNKEGMCLAMCPASAPMPSEY